MLTLPVILGTIVIGFLGYVGYLFLASYFSNTNRPDLTNAEEELLRKKREADVKHRAEQSQKKSTTKVVAKPAVSSKNKFTNSSDKRDHALFWKEIGGHVSNACCVAFSAKNALVASCSVDGMVRCIPLPDIGGSTPRDVYANFDGTPTALCFTQNGKRVVVGVDGVLKYFSISINPDAKRMEHVKDLKTGLRAVSSIQLLDVEHWMTVVACGIDEANEPCIRAFDQKGNRISNLVQVKRKGRVDKNRPPLPKKALAVASPDDRCLAALSYHCYSDHVMCHYLLDSLRCMEWVRRRGWGMERWASSRWSETAPQRPPRD
jgi:hypothetical protein